MLFYGVVVELGFNFVSFSYFDNCIPSHIVAFSNANLLHLQDRVPILGTNIAYTRQSLHSHT